LKAVILLAGKGRRLGELAKIRHKSLIVLGDKPLLGHLIDGLLYCGLDEIIPIVGHNKEEVLKYLKDNYSNKITISPVINPKYKTANNMVSLWCAKHFLNNKAFILLNGDLVLNKLIIKKLLNSSHESAISLDIKNKNKAIDSPGTIIMNNRIFDLGRHIPNENNGGYAIGVYKFGKALSSKYFLEVEKMLEKNMFQAGFHDPLIELFKINKVNSVGTGGLTWTDIDTKEDIPKAKSMLEKIIKEESDESI